MLRFVVLKKNNKLSNGLGDTTKQEEQSKLIGREGFNIKNDQSECDYGKILSISPVLIYEGDVTYIHTPLNHKVNRNAENDKYSQFDMVKMGISDIGNITYLPENYDGKEGLSYDYMSIMDNSIKRKESIFASQSRTRVSKTSDEKGFFKKTYQFLKDNYYFGFYVTLEEDWCDEEKISNEIVYLGQEKSAFVLSFELMEEKKIHIYHEEKNTDYQIYYALSDTYFDNYDDVKKTIYYSIIDKKTYRFMTRQQGQDFVSRKMMSERFQFVKAGSVFYVKKDKQQEFEKVFSNKQLQQIGFNQIIKIGE